MYKICKTKKFEFSQNIYGLKLTLVVCILALVVSLVLHLQVVGLPVDAKVWLVLFVHVFGENGLPYLPRPLQDIF